MNQLAFSDSYGSLIANISASGEALNGTIVSRLPKVCSKQAFTLELWIDGRQAYRNSFIPEDAVLW